MTFFPHGTKEAVSFVVSAVNHASRKKFVLNRQPITSSHKIQLKGELEVFILLCDDVVYQTRFPRAT